MTTDANKSRVFAMTFASIYPIYVQKAEKKGRTKSEVDEVICWLTGYNENNLRGQIDANISLKAFFTDAPKINPNASKITGKICGDRVEEIDDPLMRKIRYMDKLIDELAQGKTMEKILRK